MGRISARARLYGTAALVLPLILLFLLHGLLLTFLVRAPALQRRLLLRNVSWYSRWALRLMRVRMQVVGFDQELFARENYLFASNHMSYLDMLILAAITPSIFVTSVDMGQVRFLGTMAAVAGSLFVERRNRDRIAFDVGQLESTLHEGFHVTLFPEGTSSNGAEVGPFRRSLLTAGPRSSHKICPVTLQYLKVEGEAFGEKNCDKVCWYGRMHFFPHLLNVFSLKSIEGRVTFHLPKEFPASKDLIAEAVRSVVASQYTSRACAGSI